MHNTVSTFFTSTEEPDLSKMEGVGSNDLRQSSHSDDPDDKQVWAELYDEMCACGRGYCGGCVKSVY